MSPAHVGVGVCVCVRCGGLYRMHGGAWGGAWRGAWDGAGAVSRGGAGAQRYGNARGAVASSAPRLCSIRQSWAALASEVDAAIANPAQREWQREPEGAWARGKD